MLQHTSRGTLTNLFVGLRTFLNLCCIMMLALVPVIHTAVPRMRFLHPNYFPVFAFIHSASASFSSPPFLFLNDNLFFSKKPIRNTLYYLYNVVALLRLLKLIFSLARAVVLRYEGR